MSGTNFSTPITSTSKAQIADDNGNVLLAYGTAVPSGQSGYAIGCLFILNASGYVYTNTGSTTSCTFTKITLI